jgi:hypothetical protein
MGGRVFVQDFSKKIKISVNPDGKTRFFTGDSVLAYFEIDN